MNASLQAQNAYGRATASVRTPRSIEAHVFSSVTQKLRAAGTNFPSLVAALHENRQLWITLAGDVASDGNGLPQQLRAQLFYLAEFTEHHSQLVLKGEADAGVLVDINLAVLRGLTGKAAAA